ncbi:MAG: hypothetical protein KIT27_02420 [Legionellales bacterium]|nr:hypothetical protein [Legionellales bacterium]
MMFTISPLNYPEFFIQLPERNQHYSDIPEGDIDIDRAMAGLPAFISVADTSAFKKKKLLIGDIRSTYMVAGLPVELPAMLVLHKLLEKGFEIYQYRDERFERLSHYSISKIFHFKQPTLEEYHELMQNFNEEPNDVHMLEKNTITKLVADMQHEKHELWLSDLIALNYDHKNKFQISEEMHFTHYVINLFLSIYHYEIDDLPFAASAQQVEIIYRPQSAMYSVLHQYGINSLDLSQLEHLIIDQDLADEEYDYLFSAVSKIKELIFCQRLINIKLFQIRFEELEHIRLKSRSFTAVQLLTLCRNSPKMKVMEHWTKVIELGGEILSLREWGLLFNSSYNIQKITCTSNESFITALTAATDIVEDKVTSISLLNNTPSTHPALIVRLLKNLEEFHYNCDDLVIDGDMGIWRLKRLKSC